MNIAKVLRLDFLPANADVGLLLLRLWLGLPMLLLHGRVKLMTFGEKVHTFPALIGSSEVSFTLAVFAEFVCSALLVLGLFTRFASLNLAITMGVAFFMVHGGALTGEHSGELAFIYLAGYTVLFVAGGGRYAIDARMRG